MERNFASRAKIYLDSMARETPHGTISQKNHATESRNSTMDPSPIIYPHRAATPTPCVDSI